MQIHATNIDAMLGLCKVNVFKSVR